MRLIQRPAFLYVLALLATAVHCEEAAAPQAAPPKIFPPEIVTATLACKAQWDEACDDKKIITAPPGHKICQHEVTVVQQSGDSQYQEAASDEKSLTIGFSAHGNLKKKDPKGADIQLQVVLRGVRETESCDMAAPKAVATATAATPATATNTPAPAETKPTAVTVTEQKVVVEAAPAPEPAQEETKPAPVSYHGPKVHACACSAWIDAMKVHECLVIGHGRDNKDCGTFQTSIICVTGKDECRDLQKEFCPQIVGIDQTNSKKRIYVENSPYCQPH